jgi:hypothetical protein
MLKLYNIIDKFWIKSINIRYFTKNNKIDIFAKEDNKQIINILNIYFC